jgi:hypothetical protein
MKKSMLLVSGLSACLLFAGCSEDNPKKSVPSNAGAVQSSVEFVFSDNLVLREKPTDAVSVKDALANIEKGKEMTVAGVIGGNNCFDKELALFTLSQDAPAASDCTETGCGDCGDSQPAITVQYKDQDGKVAKRTFENFMGLKNGAKVIVCGIVDDVSTGKSMVLNLKAFHVLQMDLK